ncbi:MAG: hypothetical protein ABFC80_02505 [Coriobacteriales bacterium]
MSGLPTSGSDVPRMGTGTITRDEWLAEFERVLREMPTRDEGVTTKELGEAWDMGPRAVLDRLKKMGPRVTHGRKTIVDMAGRTTTTFCYRLRKEP